MMLSAEAKGTKVARKDQLTYYITQCPVDATCKGSKWNAKSWGFTREAAVQNFKEHLYNKHGIYLPAQVAVYCDQLEFACYMGNESVPVPPLQVPTAKRTLADQLVAEKKKKKKQTKTEPADEPPGEPPADEPAASEPGNDTVDFTRIHAEEVMRAIGILEMGLAHARNTLRQGQKNIQTTDRLLDDLNEAGAAIRGIVENDLRNQDA